MRRAVVIAAIASLWPLAGTTPAPGAAVKKRPVARAPIRKADPIGDMVVAIAVNTLGPGEGLYDACKRVSFKSLAWGLYGARGRITLDKSEYETAAEFGDRLGKMEDLLNQRGQIVICQPLDDNEDAPFRYDADREVFVGTFDEHQNVWRDVKRTGSYVSRTRMGVRATVTSSIDIEYDLQLNSLDAFARSCGKRSYGDVTYEVPAPRGTAPLLKALATWFSSVDWRRRSSRPAIALVNRLSTIQRMSTSETLRFTLRSPAQPLSGPATPSPGSVRPPLSGQLHDAFAKRREQASAPSSLSFLRGLICAADSPSAEKTNLTPFPKLTLT